MNRVLLSRSVVVERDFGSQSSGGGGIRLLICLLQIASFSRFPFPFSGLSETSCIFIAAQHPQPWFPHLLARSL
jgi:hypothetical protein